MARFDQASRRTVFELRFARYGGLVVRVRKPSARGWELLADALDVLGTGLTSTRHPALARIRAGGWLIQAFADSLVGWDLDDNGLEVAVTLDQVMDQDRDFLIDLAMNWYHKVVLLVERPAVAPAPAEQEEPTFEDELASLPVTTRTDTEEVDLLSPEPVAVG